MAHGILIAGLLLLLIGGELSIRGGVGLARLFELPPLVTGILVIGVLAVAPEFVVALRAATMGQPEIALGGLIGTNIFNLLFVMGLGALVHPLASPPKVVFRDGLAMLIACLGLIGCAFLGGVTRLAAVVGLAAFAAYVVLIFVTDWRRSPEHSIPLARALLRSEGEVPSTTGSFIVLILGIILLVLGGHLTVTGAVFLAGEIGWPTATIGLIVVAAGLSAHKLLLTLVATVRGHTAIAAGRILMTGAFSLSLVPALVALIHPMTFPPELAGRDVYILAAAGLILLPLLMMRWRLSRLRGLLLILAYGCYLGFLLWRQGLPLPWGL
jgi:cation:H+ antiporter